MDNLEEIYSKQRAGDNWILKGDVNTKIFHQFVNGRRRKNNIAYLKTDNGEIRGQKDITAHVVEFYKKLFGHNDACSLRLGDNFWPSSLTLDEEDKADLIKTFELEEIKSILMEMECSALGPDGFGANFYKNFWELIKGDVIAMFQDFWAGLLDIKRINYGVITLVPKLKEANTIKQFRPICLLNVGYKWFTKVLTNRLVPIAQKRIRKNQTSFVKGKNILEGVVVLHEVLHEMRKSKRRGLILKINFEKAYDRVR
jgi:hypothetical protein